MGKKLVQGALGARKCCTEGPSTGAVVAQKPQGQHRIPAATRRAMNAGLELDLEALGRELGLQTCSSEVWPAVLMHGDESMPFGNPSWLMRIC